MDGLDYWYAVRDVWVARDRRVSGERLDALDDRVMSAGVEGESVEYDAKGTPKPKTQSKADTKEFVGYVTHVTALRRAAGRETGVPAAKPLTALEKRRAILRRAKEKGLTDGIEG